MMRKIVYTVAALLLFASTVAAQDKALMANYQSELQGLFTQVYDAPTDNERYHANESALQLLSQALGEENSFRWTWDFGTLVSVLTAPDKKFRIFTWPVVNDAGDYECFGFVQALNEKTGEYDVYPLHDRSEEIVNRQEEVLSYDRWFGAVYQELVVTKNEGKNYYALLGWNGVDCITQRKVIEPICFKSGSSQPQFGQNIFRKEPNLRRVVLEYAEDAMVALRFEVQYVRTVERVRAKRTTRFSLRDLFRRDPNPRRRGKRGKGRAVATAQRTSQAVQERVRSAPTQKVKDEKMEMIIFDHVGPQVEGMEGLFQYYVPSGEELAYVFVNGKWQMREGAQGRLEDKKLNKDFDKPLQKDAPSYKVTFE